MKNVIVLLILISTVSIENYVLEIREEKLAFDNREELALCAVSDDFSRAARSLILNESSISSESVASGNCL